MYGRRDCDCEAAERELEDLRQREREREEQAERDRERRRREQKEAYQESLRQADNWPEAFRKQRILIAPELRMAEKTLAEVKADTRYTDEAERATDLEFWERDVREIHEWLAQIDTAEAAYRAAVQAAEAQIAAIRAGLLGKVAESLRLQHGEQAYMGDLLERLEKDDPSGWLNW